MTGFRSQVRTTPGFKQNYRGSSSTKNIFFIFIFSWKIAVGSVAPFFVTESDCLILLYSPHGNHLDCTFVSQWLIGSLENMVTMHSWYSFQMVDLEQLCKTMDAIWANFCLGPVFSPHLGWSIDELECFEVSNIIFIR